jgi:hypothetical protein
MNVTPVEIEAAVALEAAVAPSEEVRTFPAYPVHAVDATELAQLPR